MDLMSERCRIGLEKNLEKLYMYIEGLEGKQRYDITKALTGNIKDYLEFKKSSLTWKDDEDLGEDEKAELCQKIVDGALGEFCKPAGIRKFPKSKASQKLDVARALYDVELCNKCRDCGGFKCCK